MPPPPPLQPRPTSHSVRPHPAQSNPRAIPQSHPQSAHRQRSARSLPTATSGRRAARRPAAA
eukprot:11182097-Alexandrium_andersonii.AAC.1